MSGSGPSTSYADTPGGGAGSPARGRPRPGDPAVVIGPGLTALGVTRCLARAGVPVFHVDHGASIVTRSRWFRPLCPGEQAPAGAEELTARLERLPAAVLFPCSDNWVDRLAELPAPLLRTHPACLSSFDAARRLMDKGTLSGLLEETRLPHPRSRRIDGADDLAAVPPEILDDALIKPVDSQAFFRRFGTKAFRVHDRGGAVAAWERAREADLEVLVQEYVPGPPDAHVFLDGYVDRAGRLRALLARRRLRISPPGTGNSSAMVTIDLGEVEDAADSLRRLLDHVGYRGIFSAEFKRDARTGVHRLLEVNVRPWWYVEYAARCGADVCALAYRDAVGSPVPERSSYRTGVRCVYAYHDATALARMWREGTMSAGECLRAWPGATWALFAWDDPAPAVRETLDRARGWIRRRLGRSGNGA